MSGFMIVYLVSTLVATVAQVLITRGELRTDVNAKVTMGGILGMTALSTVPIVNTIVAVVDMFDYK